MNIRNRKHLCDEKQKRGGASRPKGMRTAPKFAQLAFGELALPRFCTLDWGRAAGFSLTEMLIATGIMAVGLVLIATIFPVAVKLTGLSAERSVAAVVADEAFAKIRLYGLRDFVNWPAAQLNPIAPGVPDPNAPYDFCDDFLFAVNGNLNPGGDGFWGTGDDRFLWLGDDQTAGTADDFWDNDQVFLSEFLYPSASVPADDEYKYHWSALCRRADTQDVQVTVFVTRKTSAGTSYYGFFHDRTAAPYNNPLQRYKNTSIWPMPVPVNARYNNNGVVSPPPRELVLNITDPVNANWLSLQPNLVFSFFDEGYTLVNDRDGKIYRILEMKDADGDAFHTRETIILYEDWQWDGYESDPSNPPTTAQTETVWVVPPGVGSSRYPCVGVFQKVIGFEEIE